ncbi:MAG: hypothetical protein M3O20_01200 [Acidobacteriota bacterium]|nr:hypothetical protein [Acidobacteriota bacterium]
MSTFKYNQAKTDFATGLLNWQSADICMAFTGGNYAPDPNHLTLADVGEGNLIVRDIPLSGRNVVNGICSGTIPAFNAFLQPTVVVGVLIYVRAGRGGDGTARLIYYSDDGVGFPFTPQGFNYVVSFDQTSGGFFEV